ncbi:SDR family NAD(P)-dependent oxidoreductase [Actinoplanes sp. TBRC 11911]|uniref:SDR family NAD(P)-dependent oxidoreductase n=1 Tax=Actinoplanes sp. TBRC 11911 TaxID=2729386 RepID=UPI00145F89EE|nr:SDR family NAD(P)-dependent oxidoreductase [Actinoplanes sp. TBRC 11911]NMO52931.1 SDR family NAD(P)-dependent oxidoreductase [Actinoplanes sp. TBRC 11911]
MIWFITGTSRGLGRALAIAALQAGDRVVATARKPSELDDLVARFGDGILPAELDVTRADQAESAVAAAIERFGGIDVVVNNAGYANLGPIETMDDFRTQFETNFWGVYHVTRAVLPVMKAQHGGTIVQFTSIGARVGGQPGLGSYQASKFAVDGFTRVLAAETAPFGIRTMVVEPGGFATDWSGSSMRVHDIPPEYDATVGAMARRLGDANMTQADPERGAEILVRVVKSGHLPTHLPLGANAARMAVEFEQRRLAEALKWAELSSSAAYGAKYPVDIPV